MKNRPANIIAVILLAIMFITAFFSMKEDSLTFDELAHITAGYSYLTKQDYRINPEHPPLAKDISAIPLLFLNLNFPDDQQIWLQKDSSPAWWVQFDLGREFIYRSGNNPKEIIFWSRLAMIGLLLFLGWLLFWWAKRLTNNVVALGVLTLFAFSPTFLAHGRLVNTDVGVAFGVLLATIFWLKFLQNPSKKNVLLAGLTFGIALLFKFSLILLIPFFAIITIVYALLNRKPILRYGGLAILAGIIGTIFIIWPVYQFHIWNYPAEQQIRDTIADISSNPLPVAKNVTIWMVKQEPLRAPAQYLRGVLMASQRTLWGNTTYFHGQISAGSWRCYFPLLYLFKIPLPFHVLTLFTLCFLVSWLVKERKKQKIGELARRYFWIIAFLLWLLIYWTTAITGNLNIGIRHLLPIFPFTYILVVFGVYQGLKFTSGKKILRQGLTAFCLLLFLCYIISSLLAFPYYLSYYNKLGGGIKEGYKVAVDSNYDWGQDFYRFLTFVQKEKIDKIYLDYFGGENAEYWLGEKYLKYDPKNPPAGGLSKGWIAVSLNQLMGGIADPVPGFDQPIGYYNWLNRYQPVARAGTSIFIYYIE